MENKKNIAIITARSGSKGLKDKNIKLLNGKPLIAYSIEAALRSNLFDEVFLSTDSETYAQLGRDAGANVPFLRKPEYATDTASSWDVVRDALDEYSKIGRTFDTVTLLQPTSPLRTAEDIIHAFELLKQKKADAVVSVCEVDHSPLWCNTLPEDLSLTHFLNESTVDSQRQSLSTYYRINGALYIVKTEVIKNTNDIYGHNCYAMIMPKERSVDIDCELDFIMAEAILKHYQN